METNTVPLAEVVGWITAIFGALTLPLGAMFWQLLRAKDQTIELLIKSHADKDAETKALGDTVDRMVEQSILTTATLQQIMAHGCRYPPSGRSQ